MHLMDKLGSFLNNKSSSSSPSKQRGRAPSLTSSSGCSGGSSNSATCCYVEPMQEMQNLRPFVGSQGDIDYNNAVGRNPSMIRDKVQDKAPCNDDGINDEACVSKGYADIKHAHNTSHINEGVANKSADIMTTSSNIKKCTPTSNKLQDKQSKQSDIGQNQVNDINSKVYRDDNHIEEDDGHDDDDDDDEISKYHERAHLMCKTISDRYLWWGQIETESQQINHDSDNYRVSKNLINSNRLLNEYKLNKNTANNCNYRISKSMLELDSKVADDLSAKNDHFRVSWENVNFRYQPSLIARTFSGRQNLQVLSNLRGSFKSNQLIAIIGPSGCGKTTLLQLLSGNRPLKQGCGKLVIEGISTPKVAFIGQNDELLDGLTTIETLLYASRLQNKQTKFDHKRHVRRVIESLGLSECIDRNVSKLSGGQAKRVCIAQELLYPTNLLLLDEITSGLDASTSYSIVCQLKQLTSDKSYPMSIVMTIHQPSARLFQVFDKVYLMSSGRCLYEGLTDSQSINTYLNQFQLECPKFHNVADFLIEIASDQQHDAMRRKMYEKHESNSINNKSSAPNKRPSDILTDNNTLTCCESNQEETSIDMESSHNKIPMLDGCRNLDLDRYSNLLSSFGKFGQIIRKQANNELSLYEAVEKARAQRERPFMNHFLIHFQRSSIRIRRNYILTYMQLFTYMLVSLQLTTFFGKEIGKMSGCPQLPMSFMSYVLSESTDIEDNISVEMRRLQENINFLLVTVMVATFAALEITVITFPLEARSVKREWRNGRYRVSSYFMGRTMADLPNQLVCILIFSALTYSQTGQIGSIFTWRFIAYTFILITVALYAQTIGFIFGAIFMDNLPVAVFIAPLSIFPGLLFSGFFSRLTHIPYVYEIISKISHFRYVFQTLLVTIYGFNRCECDQSVLEQYHASLNSQTSSMRDLFKIFLGTSDCQSSTTDARSKLEVEDANGFTGDINSIIASDIGNSTITSIINATSSTTTEHPLKAFEDALIDSVYAQMNSTDTLKTPIESSSSLPPQSSSHSTGAIDVVMNRFTGKITQMFNSRSNFGRPVPRQCNEFNSYSINEFELKDSDLINGCLILLVMLVVSRILCNIFLNLTMRAKAG